MYVCIRLLVGARSPFDQEASRVSSLHIHNQANSTKNWMIYRYVILFPKSPFSVSVSFFQTGMHLQTESPQDVRLWLVTAQNLLGKVFQSRDKDGCTPNVRVPMLTVFIVSSRDSWNILGKHLSWIPFRIFPEQINHHPRMVVTKKNLQKLWVNFKSTLNPQKDTRYRNPPETTRFPP